jgi:hypothetical protein
MPTASATTHSRSNGDFPEPSACLELRRLFGPFVSGLKISFPGNADSVRIRVLTEIRGYSERQVCDDRHFSPPSATINTNALADLSGVSPSPRRRSKSQQSKGPLSASPLGGLLFFR